MRPCWRARSERHTCSPVLTSMPMTVRCAIPMASPFVVRGVGGKQGKRLRRMIWPDPHRLLKKALLGFFAYPLGIVHFRNAPPEWTEAFFCKCLMSQNLSDHLKLESWNMK